MCEMKCGPTIQRHHCSLTVLKAQILPPVAGSTLPLLVNCDVCLSEGMRRRNGTPFAHLPLGRDTLPCNQEPGIELAPGLVAPASVKRRTDPEWRSGECEVHPSLELLTCIPFSRALKGTSDEESSRLSDPETSSLSRMQTKRMLISAFPNCLGKEEEKKGGVAFKLAKPFSCNF